jgi:putative secretion ATPase (PEP-CTERM system associated)
MYERFYHLRERPFALSPDPEYLYPSRVHQEALDYLRYGVESHAGFIVITGEIGSGKTTLLQTLLRNLDTQTTVGRIVNTMLEPRELLETILIDFGLDPGGRSKPLLLRDLSQYLVDQRVAGRLVLLVIDEAQNLGLPALEELRMLSNLETEKSKLLQIVLVGQPNLRDKLAAPELEQLRQRMTVSYHLRALDAEETGRYVNHRLRHAALGAPLEFPPEATALIHARSGGVPRIINVICDAALVFGYAEERRDVDEALMTQVLAELEATGVLPATNVPAQTAESNPLSLSPIEGSESPSQTPSRKSRRQRRNGGGSSGAPQSQVDVAAAEARAAALEQREHAVRARERELEEQRQALEDEYRQLRAAPPPSHAEKPVMPAPVPNVARFDAVHVESFWDRLKRIMLGVSVS